MQDSMWRDWLHHRKISDAVIKDFDLHEGSNPIFGSCLVIPVLDESGVFLFNKYRRNPFVEAKPKYVYDKGGKVTLYGLWKAKDCTSILITEGEMDALVGWSATIPSISSTGGAHSFQEEWGEVVKNKDVIVCFDNDLSGGSGMVKVLKIVPHAKVVFLPDRPGVKDISDYVSGGGNLAELIRTAIHFDSVQDVIDHRSTRLSLWQSTFFHDAYIEENTVPEFVHRSTSSISDRVSKAKEYPIDTLLRFDRTGKALCIWHAEHTPSLHYYRKENRVYCFGGCGKGADAIDVYRQIHGCSFREAVTALT